MHQRALVSGGAVHRCRHDHVGDRSGEHRCRLGQRPAASPALDHPRVAGLGHRVGAEIGSHQQGVGVLPRDLGLGLRKLEAVGDECPCRHVEFAHDRGIRAAARQADQRAGVVGLDHVGAGPHPVGVVGAGELVDVDQDVPLRFLGSVVRQRGPPPQAAWVVGIAPEVVQVLAAPPHVGDAGIGVEHLEGLGPQLLEAIVAKLVDGRLVVPAHPVQGVVAGDVLQPQIGVVRHGCHCGRAGTVSWVTPP